MICGMKLIEAIASLRFSILISKKEINASPKTSITATTVSIMLNFTTLNRSSAGRIKYNFFMKRGTMLNYIMFDERKIKKSMIIVVSS